jgi:hypothetical protein
MVSRHLKARWLRMLVSVVSVAALSAALVPVASAQITAPPSPVQVGPFITVSNLTINGQATTMAAVAPGANATIAATVTEDRHGYCPGCIAFVPVKLAAAAAPAGCLLNHTIGNNHVVSGSVNVTAPTSPGVYDVVAGYALQFSCIWAVGDTQTTIARLVVPATSDQLCSLVRSYSSKRAVATALCFILRFAQFASDHGLTRAATNIRHVFTILVTAQTGRAFTPQQADVLKLLVTYL